MLNGEDLRRAPYVDRKAALRKLLRHGRGTEIISGVNASHYWAGVSTILASAPGRRVSSLFTALETPAKRKGQGGTRSKINLALTTAPFWGDGCVARSRKKRFVELLRSCKAVLRKILRRTGTFR
jgi:hypothetical protein